MAPLQSDTYYFKQVKLHKRWVFFCAVQSKCLVCHSAIMCSKLCKTQPIEIKWPIMQEEQLICSRTEFPCFVKKKQLYTCNNTQGGEYCLRIMFPAKEAQQVCFDKQLVGRQYVYPVWKHTADRCIFIFSNNNTLIPEEKLPAMQHLVLL